MPLSHRAQAWEDPADFEIAVALVQARANHPDGVTLDDGTHIPPFWGINTYTLIKTDAGWKVALQNIHNQINFEEEGRGQHVPNPSPGSATKK